MQSKGYYARLIVGNLVLIGGVVCSVYVAVKLFKGTVGLGVMGIGILLTVLIGGNILSKEHDLTTGEVRRAIAIACVAVFFGLLFLDSIPEGLKPVMEQFWWIIVAIIGFYFGGRSAEEIVKSIVRARK